MISPFPKWGIEMLWNYNLFQQRKIRRFKGEKRRVKGIPAGIGAVAGTLSKKTFKGVPVGPIAGAIAGGPMTALVSIPKSAEQLTKEDQASAQHAVDTAVNMNDVFVVEATNDVCDSVRLAGVVRVHGSHVAPPDTSQIFLNFRSIALCVTSGRSGSVKYGY